jgi:hypothetical protein
VGSGFGKSIYLDFHLEELQLFVTPHKLDTLFSLSCIPALGFFLEILSPVVFCLSAASAFCTGLSGRRILTSLAGESPFTGPVLSFLTDET